MADKMGDGSELSAEYDTPMGLSHGTMAALKERIKTHYDLASDYYLDLWGEHIHHGYWPTEASKATDTKEQAQLNLVDLLLQVSSTEPAPGLRVLDVGCGLGGTSRLLASRGASVTGVTISGRQVEMARKLSNNPEAAGNNGKGEAEGEREGEGKEVDGEEFIPFGKGRVKFLELDAERMAEKGGVGEGQFDLVWISEALSHIPGKEAFFRNAHAALAAGGKLVIADWFKGDVPEGDADIKAIEDGMLLPPLHTQDGYVDLAKKAGFEVLSEPKDISKDVAKTWDITWSLVQSPSLWAFALSQGRDGIAFLQAFRAMRRGYAGGGFRYGVMAFVRS